MTALFSSPRAAESGTLGPVGPAILNCLPLPPLGDRLRVDPKLTAKLPGQSL